jgi:hypothetical protein
MSPSPPGLEKDEGLRAMNQYRSYVLFDKPGGDLCWWFLYFKNDPKTRATSIPKYTVGDEKRLVEKYAVDKIGGTTTFGRIYETAKHTVLVPIEEFVLDRFFYGRIVLVGDACHKMHPFVGQGANSAIESAAYVADIFWDIVQRNATDDKIQTAFTEYQNVRRPRTKEIMGTGHFISRLDTQDTWLLKFLASNIFPGISLEDGLLPQFANMFLPAVSLQHLPQPKQPNHIPWEDQMKMRPKDRSLAATISWILLLLLAGRLGIFIPSQLHLVGFYGENPVLLSNTP